MVLFWKSMVTKVFGYHHSSTSLLFCPAEASKLLHALLLTVTGESTRCTLLSSTRISLEDTHQSRMSRWSAWNAFQRYGLVFCDHLALAHRALTSFSLMSSHLLSWSICLSRSLMSPMTDRWETGHTARTDQETPRGGDLCEGKKEETVLWGSLIPV